MLIGACNSMACMTHHHTTRPTVSPTPASWRYALQMHSPPSKTLFNYGDAEEEAAGTLEPFPAGPLVARYSANLLGLARRFPSLGPAPAVVARSLLRTPDPSESGSATSI